MPPTRPQQPLVVKKIQTHVENQWLNEVYDGNTGKWSGYETWAAIYEPKKERKEDSERKKKMKAKVSSTIKTNVLTKLEHAISTKLVLVSLEIASKILTQVQAKLLDNNDSNEKGTASSSNNRTKRATKKIINHCHAIVLSYRFDRSKRSKKKTRIGSSASKKLAFLRAAATDGLAATLLLLVDDDSQQQLLPAIQREIRNALASLSPNIIRGIVEQQLSDNWLVLDFANIDKLEDMEERVGSVLANTSEEAEAIPKAAGIQRPLPSVAIMNIPTTKEQAQTNKKEMVQMLATVLNDGVLSKLDHFHVTISRVLDELLVEFTLATTRAAQQHQAKINESSNRCNKKDAASNSDEKLQVAAVAIKDIVEKMYYTLEKTIHYEVSKIIALIGSMMGNEEEDDDDETEEE